MIDSGIRREREGAGSEDRTAEKCKHYNTISPNLLLFTAEEQGMLLPQPPVAALILHRSLSAFDSAQSIMFEKHSGSLLSLQGDITGFSDKPLTEFCIQHWYGKEYFILGAIS